MASKLIELSTNIKGRKAAEGLHQAVGDLLRDEVRKLPSDRAREQFWLLMLHSVQKNLPPAVVAENVERKPRKPATTSLSYDEAMVLVNEIRDLAPDICEAGQDFAASVEEKTEAIAESVERSMSATENQIAALENMLDGLRRWFHD